MNRLVAIVVARGHGVVRNVPVDPRADGAEGGNVMGFSRRVHEPFITRETVSSFTELSCDMISSDFAWRSAAGREMEPGDRCPNRADLTAG